MLVLSAREHSPIVARTLRALIKQLADNCYTEKHVCHHLRGNSAYFLSSRWCCVRFGPRARFARSLVGNSRWSSLPSRHCGFPGYGLDDRLLMSSFRLFGGVSNSTLCFGDTPKGGRQVIKDTLRSFIQSHRLWKQVFLHTNSS